MAENTFGICPYMTVQRLLAGKWTLLIMHYLSKQTMRWGELQRVMPDVTQATLTKHLRMMEENGLVDRQIYNQIPPKVEYSLSDLGERFVPVLEALKEWGDVYIEYLRSKKKNE